MDQRQSMDQRYSAIIAKIGYMAVAAEGYPDPLDKFAAQDVLSARY